MKKYALATALVSALAAGSANATTLFTPVQTAEYDAGFTFATTNWTDILSALAQFNPALGTLTSVHLNLLADIQQDLKAENLGATPDVLTPMASGSVAFRQGTTALLTATPSASGPIFAAAAYDGTTDYAGPSGTDFGMITATDTQSTVLTTGLAGFIGTGDLSAFNLRAVGSGSIDSDNGNLASEITTMARGRLELFYDYTPNEMPEPASMLLVGLGLLGAGFARRRKA